MTESSPTRSQAVGVWVRLVAWVAAGALLGFGVLTLLTIGLLLIAAGVGLVWLLTTRRAAGTPDRHAIAGLIAGLATPLGLMAWLNRSGPGQVCTSSRAQTSCTTESSPWIYLAVMAGLLIVAALVGLSGSRTSATQPQPE